MTDEKRINILKLAAESAGIKIHRIIQANEEEERPFTVLAWVDEDLREWNPLEYDKDTYDLSKRLKISVIYEKNFIVVRSFGRNWSEYRIKYDECKDIDAALRLNITTLAAWENIE